MKDVFKDSGERLEDFGNNRIVVCPKCSKPIDYYFPRLVCIHCGFNKVFENQDFLFQIFPRTSLELKYFLKAPCCKHIFWAQNLSHLDFLENYVKAKLRTRKPNHNKSIASRLPKWMKDAKNRDEILNTIKILRNKLKKEGYKSQ